MPGPTLSGEHGQHVPSAERTLDILEYVANRPWPVSAVWIARACGLPRSSTYQLLKRLRSRGFLTYFPSEHAWAIGPAAVSLAASQMLGRSLARLAQPLLVELADEEGWPAFAAVSVGSEMLFVAAAKPSDRPVFTEAGVRLPSHLHGAGWACLMAMSLKQLRALFPSNRALTTSSTRTGPRTLSRLDEVLSSARARRFAFESGVAFEGVASIAVPVSDDTEQPRLSLCVSLPSSKAHPAEQERLGERLRSDALSLSTRMGWSEASAEMSVAAP